MKKKLIIKNEVVEMTFEEVLEQFTPAIHREINKQKAKVDRPEEERDDMFQYASMFLWRAYEKYDIEKGFHFSTHAQKYIQYGVQQMDILNKRQKRAGLTVSLDAQLSEGEEDFTLQNILSEEIDMNAPIEAREILKSAVDLMSDTEAEYLVYMLKEYSQQEVADEKGISRQGARDVYMRIRKKVKLAMENYN